MSTIARQNFEPARPFRPDQVADFPLNDPNLADPTNAVCLIDGEWMTLNTSYKAIRASVIGTPGDPSLTFSFPYFLEKGRTDVQAMGERKASLLWKDAWEFDTRLYDAAAVVGSGTAITGSNMFKPVKVATITISGRNVSGLVGHGGSGDAHPIVGYITRFPTTNGGKLRIRGGMIF